MSFMGNSFVGFWDLERNSPKRLGARLPRARVIARLPARAPLLAPSLGGDIAAPDPRRTSAGFPAAERRRSGAAYLRLRPACALPAPGCVPGARRRPWGQRSPGRASWAQVLTAPSHLSVQAPGGGPPLYLQEEAVPGGCGGLGNRELGRAGWRELATTGCYPLGAENVPGVGVHCEPRPHGPGMANLDASPGGTVCAWNPGETGSPAVSRERSPRRVGAASWGSPGCRNCALRRPRSRRREGSQFPLEA